MPTKNEEKDIVASPLSVPPEVDLIVFDFSDDATPQVIRSPRPERTRLCFHPGGISEARQLGADAAPTRWLLFSDADVRYSSGSFQRRREVGNEGVVYGTKSSSGRFSRYDQVFRWIQGLIHRLGSTTSSGSNLLIRSSALAAAGGFDTRLTCNEDAEVVFRIMRLGYPIRFDPELPVLKTDHRRLERGIVRKILHSLLRCFLLYFNLMPSRWRSRAWGYWLRTSNNTGETSKGA